MRLAIRHQTRYRFARPPRHGLQRLRLTPKHTSGQSIVDWSMELVGATRQVEYDDQNRNHVTLIALQPNVEELIIECHGAVDTADLAGINGRHSGHLPLWHFLEQTPLTKPGTGIARMVSAIGKDKGDRLSLLHRLSEQVRQAIDYTPGATMVDTSAEEALTTGAGVCQDHAHVFISAARAMGTPARYVSGYLMMNDRIDQDAGHGWAEAHVDGLGWVGFDISNGISPDPRYVRVATGRDYREAAPITGISIGGTGGEVAVELAVEQQTVEQRAAEQ